MFKKITLILTAVGLLGIVASQAANAADSVSQALNAGTRSASNADLSLTAKTYSHSDQTSTGSLTLTADDSTGTGLGWNVTVQSSAFVYSGGNGGSNISAANFSITSNGTASATAGQAVDVVGGPKAPVTGSTGTLDSARKVLQASVAFGMGTYTQANAVSLTIPGGSRAGTYTGTLTTTISAGP